MDAPTFRTAIGAGTGGGSVTSVATAGTVNGLTLTGGPITTTGTVTLGGTLDLSSPPAIGGTTPAAGTFTTLTAQNEVLKGTGQNLFSYSEQIDNGFWAKENLTVTADATTSPTGTTTADSLVESVGAGNHGIYRSQQLSAGTYTLSGYFKANTRQYIILAFSNNAGSGYASAVFDVSGGTVTKTGNAGNFTYLSSAITSVGNGWYRCSITASATEQLYYVEYYLSNVASPTFGGFGVLNYTGNGSSLYGWGLQLEIASTVGTYIPTTTTAVYGTPTLSFSGVASIGLQSDGSLYETSAGTGNVRFYTNNIAQEQMRVSHTASAVNYVQVTGAATGNAPAISVQGSDANVGITVQGKGAGSAILQANSTGNALFATDGGLTALRAVPRVASGDTWLDVQRGVGAVILSAASGTTNGDITLTPRGTGVVRTSGTGIRLYGSSSGYVGLTGAAAAGSTTYTLPAADGTTGQMLSTNGSGTLSWATGGGSNIAAQGLWENALTISSNYSVTSGNSAMSAGPITIASGVSVTVPSGSRWVIV
jgi:hypothetical protein